MPRRYKTEKVNLTPETYQRALDILALIISKYGTRFEHYISLYQRLESEKQELENNNDSLSRILQHAAKIISKNQS